MDNQTDVPQLPAYFYVNGRLLFFKDYNFDQSLSSEMEAFYFSIRQNQQHSNTPHQSVSRCGISSGHHKGNNSDKEDLGVHDEIADVVVVEDATGKDGGPRQDYHLLYPHLTV